MDELKRILAQNFEVKISFDFGSYTVTIIFDGEEWNWFSDSDLTECLKQAAGYAESIDVEEIEE